MEIEIIYILIKFHGNQDEINSSSGKFFLLLNSCANFLIYVMCSPKFRKLLTKELGKIFRYTSSLFCLLLYIWLTMRRQDIRIS